MWLAFLAQFTALFAVVLLVASATTFLAYLLQHPRDIGTARLAIAILCVVVLNGVIGFLQEYSAQRTAQALQAMVPNIGRVLRDGLRQEIAGSALVPGDLVLPEAGDAVPADRRLVEAHSFAVNDAPLTGESARSAGGRSRPGWTSRFSAPAIGCSWARPLPREAARRSW